MTLVDQLNQSPFDFYFLVVDDMLDIQVPELNNFISLSAPRLHIQLSDKNSGRLLSHPTTIKFITDHSAQTGHTPVIVPFKPSARLDLLCRQHHWICASNPSATNRLFEDKIKFYQLCHQHQLPLIPALILPFTPTSYHQAQKQFGPKLVLQTHFGWAGNSSYISQSYSDVATSIAPQEIVKFSPYLEGYSLINNCCLINHQLVDSPPGLQYTGLPELTSNPLATVGRQWPSFTPPKINSQVQEITSHFSQLLLSHHYRGFFGLDFFVHQHQVYLLECNPRLTASFAFYTTLEKNLGLTPLFFLHLAEFIGLTYSEPSHFSAPISGSELVNRQLRQKIQSSSPYSPTYQPITIDPSVIAQVL